MNPKIGGAGFLNPQIASGGDTLQTVLTAGSTADVTSAQIALTSTATSGTELAITATPGSARTSGIAAITAAGANWDTGSSALAIDVSSDVTAYGIKINSGSNGVPLLFERSGSSVWWLRTAASAGLELTQLNDIATGPALLIGPSGAGKEMTASSGTQEYVKIAPYITQTATAGYVGILLDVAETATGSGTKELMALRVGGTDKFTVSNTGLASGLGGYVTTSDGDTGGAGSAGAGNQYIELCVNGTVYKVLHDGTV